jgi:hypothetical protein
MGVAAHAVGRGFTFALIVVTACMGSSVSAQQTDSIQLQGSGTFFDNTASYAYAPSCIYDAAAGKFRLYITRGVAGDFVSLKESSTYEGLAASPWQDVFKPSGRTGTFDKDLTADPDVYEYEGKRYLAYTGFNGSDPQGIQSRIGIAVWNEGKRQFQRIYSAAPIIEPTYGGAGARSPNGSNYRPYGAGQPSVCRGPDGQFYLSYFDQFTNPQGNLEAWIRVIRCPSPSFPPGLQQRVVSYPADQVGGASVTLAFNRGRNQFEIVANLSDTPNRVWVRLAHFDRAFARIGSTDYKADVGFQFGEGVAIVRTPSGDIVPWSDAGSRMHLNFVAATWGPPRGTIPQWVTGPTKWVRFTEGPNGVLTPNSLLGDIALDGDLDGDGRKDHLLVNLSTLQWRWRLSSTGFATWQSAQWGLPGQDIPLVTRDWNRDGRDEIAVYRTSYPPTFYIRYSGSGTSANFVAVQWGLVGDRPFSADTNGDRRGELIAWRPSERTWYVLRSGTWGNGDYAIIPLGNYPDGLGYYVDASNIADLNWDGRDDFVSFSSQDGFTWWKLN